MALPTIDIAGNSVVYSLGREIAKLTDFAHGASADVSWKRPYHYALTGSPFTIPPSVPPSLRPP